MIILLTLSLVKDYKTKNCRLQVRRLLDKGIKRGAEPLWKNYLPSPLTKGRGTKGEGLLNNLSYNTSRLTGK
jgi:hypothetical protein